MLLLSVEGFLRFFPAWPLGEEARFQGLRASGAFLVTAAVDRTGLVGGVEVVAEAGGPCRFLPPPSWAPSAPAGTHAEVAVTCDGRAVATRAAAGGTLTFDTSRGQRCTLARSK